MLIQTTIRCADCGEELIPRTYEPKINNVGDLENVFVYVEACKCGSDRTDKDVDDYNDIPPEFLT